MSKKLKDQTIKNNFMFGAVMLDVENCQGLLELALGFPISRVEVDVEKSIVYHPEYRGIRLDVYAKDEEQTHYNVEIQVSGKPALGKRSRYYHSQMDMSMLLSGMKYEKLPKAYVIFICDFDPFGQKKYCYSFNMRCDETGRYLGDESVTIFLSTKGKNANEVSPALVSFLKYVAADVEDENRDYENDYVRRLQESVTRIKNSRDMEERFMLLEEMMEERAEEGRCEGRCEGKREDVIALLSVYGQIPTSLQEMISGESDPEILQKYLLAAAKATSINDFLDIIKC